MVTATGHLHTPHRAAAAARCAGMYALEIPDGICASPAQVTDGCVCDLGTIEGNQVPRAQQAGPLDGVTALGLDPIASLLGN
jgi:hypothetical protein